MGFKVEEKFRIMFPRAMNNKEKSMLATINEYGFAHHCQKNIKKILKNISLVCSLSIAGNGSVLVVSSGLKAQMFN